MNPRASEPPSTDSGLVDASTLLAVIWPNETSRPSLRWLREQQRKKSIPYLKVGHKVFFSPVKVRAALERNFEVRSL